MDDKNYSRATIYRSSSLIVKLSYWKGSLQRYEFYFYKLNKPEPIKIVNVYLDGKVIIE